MAHLPFRYVGLLADLRSIFDDRYSLPFAEEVKIHNRAITRFGLDADEEYESEENNISYHI